MYNPTKIHSPDIKDAITRITRLTYNQIPSSITQKQGWPPTWTSAGRRRGCSSTDSAQARPSSNQSTQTTTRETSDGAAGKRCVQVVTVTPRNRMTEEGQSSSPEPKKKRWHCCRWLVRSKEGRWGSRRPMQLHRMPWPSKQKPSTLDGGEKISGGVVVLFVRPMTNREGDRGGTLQLTMRKENGDWEEVPFWTENAEIRG